MEAHERGDVEALAALLREDARVSAPPHPVWYDGREAFLRSARRGAEPRALTATWRRSANGQPAAASYIRERRHPPTGPLAIDVLRVETA